MSRTTHGLHDVHKLRSMQALDRIEALEAERDALAEMVRLIGVVVLRNPDQIRTPVAQPNLMPITPDQAERFRAALAASPEVSP